MDGAWPRRFVGAITAMVTALSVLLSVTPAHAVPADPVDGPDQRVIFNNPWGGTAAQRRIADEYIRLIDTAPAGTEVRIGFYSLSDVKLTSAIIEAEKRGVRIQVIVNRHAWSTKQVKRLRKALGSNRSAATWVSKRPKNWTHSKFLAIEYGEIVVISSQNGTKSGIWQQQNDAAITYGDHTLYQAVVRQFDLMGRGETSSAVLGTRVSSGTTTLRFYPASRANGYATFGLLDDITCEVDGERTKVWGVMWIWTVAGKPVANRLATLARQGCDVRMIVSTQQTTKSIRKILLKGGVATKVPKGSKWPHSKYFVVDGHDADGQRLQVVYAGSPNLTAAAFNSNDEIGLTSVSPALVTAYETNHRWLWDSHTRKLTK